MMRRVLLIHPEGNTFTNPTLKSLLDLLLDKGVDVTICSWKARGSWPVYRGVQRVVWNRYWARVKKEIHDCFCWDSLAYASMFAESILMPANCDLIVAVDRHGLIDAHYLSRITNVPYVLFSFEIMFESESSSKYKSIERLAGANLKKWFVQDEIRAARLAEENFLDLNNCEIVPLASAGAGCFSLDRLRDRLGIPEEKKVAMFLGTLSEEWTMLRDVLISVSQWPENWCLILHDRYGDTQNSFSKIASNMSSLVGDKIFLSIRPEDCVDQMGGVLAGIDVGLAFYNPDYRNLFTGRNLLYLGLSSGKISTFLRFGIPVIMNEVGLYADLANRCGFGVVVKTPKSIPAALEQVSNPAYAKFAQNFFDQNLDFNLYKERIWLALTQVSI